MKALLTTIMITIITLTWSGLTFAQHGPMNGQRGAPPQEAIDACNGQSTGDQVSFETPRGETVSGTCREIQGQMVAVPENSQGNSQNGENFVRRLDKDGDGKVSRSEFDGPAKHFADFDSNTDGYISASEAPTGPPPRRN